MRRQQVVRGDFGDRERPLTLQQVENAVVDPIERRVSLFFHDAALYGMFFPDCCSAVQRKQRK